MKQAEVFLGESILAERGRERKTKSYGSQGAPQVLTVGFRTADVPVATQIRLSFDVILPLWGRRGPR
jgi:hypothetical protein